MHNKSEAYQGPKYFSYNGKGVFASGSGSSSDDVRNLLPLYPIIEIVPFSWNNSCRWMQYGLSFVALLEIYAVEGEKSGT